MLTDHDDMSRRSWVDAYFFAIPSMFSFFGCLLVVISIIKLKKLQTVTFMIIGFQMSAEGLYNLGHAIFLYPPKDNTPLCTIQAFILAWSLNVTILMTGFMSYHMYRCITRKSLMHYNLTHKQLLVVVVVVMLYSIGVALVPWLRDGYGLEGSQCWLAPHNGHIEHTIFVMTILYGPLWICIFFSMASYVTIFKFVRRIGRPLSRDRRQSSDDKPLTSQRTENVVRKLMYYPAILMLCWSGITLLRVHIMFHPDIESKDIFLWLAHGLLQLQGIFDTIVFLSYSSVQSEYRRLYELYHTNFFASRTESNDGVPLSVISTDISPEELSHRSSDV